MISIAQAITPRSYKRGDIIVEDGEESKEFFIIRKGVAEHLKDGDFFGERCILLNTKRTSTIVAIASTRCYVIQAADFRNLMEVPLKQELGEQIKEYEQLNFYLSTTITTITNNNNKDDNDNNVDNNNNTNGNSNKNNNNKDNDMDIDADKENLNNSTVNICTLDEFENICILGVSSFGRVSCLIFYCNIINIKQIKKFKLFDEYETKCFLFQINRK
ncbi:hypothetical protein RFI_40064 [Reticulomyxa filosa]|uniref:Cyclic nucleotide-binding domain-containing protein n=1 Tax=Reticulomyxa filosa TaxID=46433 RepID=X6L7S0_RETFI|nr:hypothetical protein RFI_40064 [Reticulomyxa filosa]|eukprot:ETN97465.1 hypothetical protein RFI_40064 [Reticulomyxa filosa]